MRKCAVCGKTSYMGWTRILLRGNYNPTSKKRKYPNLQWLTLANKKRVKACTKCMKSLHKNTKQIIAAKPVSAAK